METELGSKIIRELKEVATVDVVVDGSTSRKVGAIVIDTMKLKEIMCGYDYLRSIVQRTWSNLPSPPVPEKTHVIVWVIVTNDYGINHSTIRWPGANPNTFVHLWSIMDRIKMSLTGVDVGWLVGSRNCIDYCSTTGMSLPIDTYMYPREQVTPDPIAKMKMNPEPHVFEELDVVNDSFYDFVMSTYTPRRMEMLNVSSIGLDPIMKEQMSRRGPWSG